MGNDVVFDVSVDAVQQVRGGQPRYSELTAVSDGGDTCCLGVSVSSRWPDGPQLPTRAALSTLSTLQDETSSGEGFGLFQYDDSNPLSLNNVQYRFASYEWRPQVNEGAQWPGSGTTVFYAYAPYDDSYSLTDRSKLSFTVPATNSSQIDLLVASHSCPGNSSGRVKLDFAHALTAVRFVAGDGVDLTIKSVTFKGVANTGRYDFADKTWTEIGGSEDMTLAFESPYRTVTGSASLTDVTSADEFFFMMPQTLISASLEIECDDASKYTFSLNGTDAWEPGMVVTYELNKAVPVTYNFSVNRNVVVSYLGFDTNGDNGSFTITSTKKPLSGGGVPVSVPFSLVEFQKYNPSTHDFETDATNTWLTSCTPDPVNDSPVSVSIAPAAPSSVSDADVYYSNILANNKPLGTQDDPYDLSLLNPLTGIYGGKRNTANCYVIQAPGWYQFPVVYGNAIKNGSTSVLSADGIVDSRGNPINYSNYYPGQSGSSFPSSAEVVWQDKPLLIQNASIVTVSGATYKYVKFYVDQSRIRQGNALLAVKNGSSILWSWHIWFTPINLQHVVYTGTSSSTAFMPVCLGWEDRTKSVTVYPQTVGKLIYKQNGSNQTLEVTITQQAHIAFDSAVSGVCTTYQWGRNTPFVPIDSQTKRNVPLYTSSTSPDSRSWVLYDQTNANRANEVLQPTTLFADMMYQLKGNLAWNSNKTIHDPCPVGYRVPTQAVFEPVRAYVAGHLNDTSEPSKYASGVAIYRVKKSSEVVGQLVFPNIYQIRTTAICSFFAPYHTVTRNSSYYNLDIFFNGTQSYNREPKFSPIGESDALDFYTRIVLPMADF